LPLRDSYVAVPVLVTSTNWACNFTCGSIYLGW